MKPGTVNKLARHFEGYLNRRNCFLTQWTVADFARELEPLTKCQSKREVATALYELWNVEEMEISLNSWLAEIPDRL
jgi:hypothetical protein